MKIVKKADYKEFRPIYTWNRGRKDQMGLSKSFQRTFQKQNKTKLFPDLSQTAWKIIIWCSSPIVSVGGDA